MFFEDLGQFWSVGTERNKDGKPARRVVTGRHHRPTGYFPSRKSATGRQIPWESGLERAFLHLAEFDPRVVSIHPQPHRLLMTCSAGQAAHTPDYLVQYAHGRAKGMVIEVKPREEAEQPAMHAKLRRSAKAHRAMGYSFALLTEVELRRHVARRSG